MENSDSMRNRHVWINFNAKQHERRRVEKIETHFMFAISIRLCNMKKKWIWNNYWCTLHGTHFILMMLKSSDEISFFLYSLCYQKQQLCKKCDWIKIPRGTGEKGPVIEMLTSNNGKKLRALASIEIRYPFKKKKRARCTLPFHQWPNVL